MRLLLAIVVTALFVVPGLLAGWPHLAPAGFAGRIAGVPGSVVAMVVLMAALIVLASVCSSAAGRDQ